MIEGVIHWVVLDGLIDPLLLETLQSLANTEGITLPNGENIKLPGKYLSLNYTCTCTNLHGEH